MKENVKLSLVISDLESGARPKGGVSSESGTIPSLGAEHLSDDGGFNFHKIKYITVAFFEKLNSGKIKYNDILIVKDGATTGKVSFVNIDFPFNKAAINEHVFRIAIDKKKSSPKYIYYFLKSNDGKKQILNDFRGATVGGISRQFIESTKIPLPPLDDQIRIAEVLTRAEKLIAKRKESIKALDELLKSTFLEMFGDSVRNEKGWEKRRIDQFAETRLGKMRSKQFITGKHLKNYLGNSNVRWFSFDFTSLEKMDFNTKEQSIFSLKKGDLLVCEGGEIGRCAIWKAEKEDIYFQKALHRIRINKKIINNSYLAYIFYSYAFNNGFKNVGNKATIAHLTGEKLKETLVPIPPLPLQNQFAAIVEKVESIKTKYNQNLTELENFYGSLSQRAFKGELDLSKVPLPEKEPASEEAPLHPFDEGLSEEAKKALADLYSFNQNSEAIKALQDAVRSIDPNSPALRMAREMAEQAAHWKTPMDELKNMSSVVRSLVEIIKPSLAMQKIAAEQFTSIQQTAKMAAQIAKSVPKIDFSMVAQQKKLLESAIEPFTRMQQAMANIAPPLKGLQDPIESFTQIGDNFQSSVTGSSDDEQEPKRIFTRYDIMDALADGTQLSFQQLSEKLTELETINMAGYERIREHLFVLLKNGEIEQFFDEKNDENKILKFKAVI